MLKNKYSSTSTNDPTSNLLSLNYLGVMVILGISPKPSITSVAEDNVIYCQNQWLDGETRVFSMPFDVNKTMW